MNTRETHSIQIPPKLALQNFMEDQTPKCSLTSQCSIILDPQNVTLQTLNSSKSPANVFDLTPIINIYFNKHPMSWKLIHWHLLHPSASVMKSMFYHQNLTGLPQQCHNKLNQAPCKIFYTSNMTTFPIVTTVDKNTLKTGELIHM